MTLNLTVLGASGSGPQQGRAASGYLVRSEKTSILVDAGTGVFMELAKHLDPADLSAVFVSHSHADHSADILGLVHYLAYRDRSGKKIPLYAPQHTIDTLAAYLSAGTDGPFHHVLPPTAPVPGLQYAIGDVGLRFAEANHSVPTLAVRIEHANRVLVYSGDTGPGGGFPDLAAGGRTLLIEAGLVGTREDTPYPFHLSAAEAATIAADVEADRLVLTHLASTVSEEDAKEAATAMFQGDVVLAQPGLSLDI